MSGTPGRAGQARALSQLVAAPLTPAAIFLVVTIKPGPEAETAAQSLCANMANLLRAVGFRDLDGQLSCIVSFGSEAWDRLFGEPRPAELHPFREVRGGKHVALATPGDILFHIRARRMDLCFELASQIMNQLGEPLPLPTRFMASAFSISAIFWDLSTAPKIRMVRRRSMQPWSATRIPILPAAAM